MKVFVKAYTIDRRARVEHYGVDLQEYEVDTDIIDEGELGKELHDLIFGERDRRYFIKVIGIKRHYDNNPE